MKRILSMLIAVMMLVTVFTISPMTVSAGPDLSAVTCSSFISNSTAREYIDMMMEYYLTANPNIVTAMDNGKSAIFMFEGGSDNYSSASYSTSSSNIRNQAVCIVVKKVSGKYSIVFYDENSSSIPSQPQSTGGGANDGQTTILDGIYSVYTWNHQGKYGALQINTSKGYYTPPSNLNGVVNTASGINIHTRTSSQALSGGSAWSWGCQLIGSGNTTANTFNTFMKTVTGITYNVWNSWGDFNTITTGTDAGYYILDRQLALSGLASLYNSTALSNITAASRTAREEATKNYLNNCTYYPSYCDIRFTASTKAYSYPCTTETDSTSVVIATIPEGQEVPAYALYLNDKNEYWYKIITYGTTPAYVYAGDTEFLSERYDDVRIEDGNSPINIPLGNVYAVKGVAKSDYNKITGISAYALYGFDENGEVATGGNDSISGNSYSLAGSNVDNKLLFNKLDAGNYTYVIFVNAENHHATSGSTKTESVKALLMKADYFTVGSVGNIALDADYTISGNGVGFSSYTADLTDGQASTALSYDNNWFAFYYNADADASAVNSPDGIGTAVIDLGNYYDVHRIRLNLLNYDGADITEPEYIRIYESIDGESFTYLADAPTQDVQSTSYWSDVSADGSARYIKIEFKLTKTFAFVNEIEIYGVEAESIPEPKPDYILGDVNGDGGVDSVDYLMVKRYCFGSYALTDDEMIRADVDLSQKVDSLDYVLVKRIAFNTYTA